LAAYGAKFEFTNVNGGVAAVRSYRYTEARIYLKAANFVHMLSSWFTTTSSSILSGLDRYEKRIETLLLPLTFLKSSRWLFH
jgi:hypothetical protein